MLRLAVALLLEFMGKISTKVCVSSCLVGVYGVGYYYSVCIGMPC